MNNNLTFSDFGSNYINNERSSSFRKAGEIFSDANTTNDNSGPSRARSSYDSWMSNLSNGNSYPSYNSSSNSNSSSSSSSQPSNTTTPSNSASPTPAITPASQPKPSANTDKKGRPISPPPPPTPAPKSKQSLTDKKGRPISSPNAGMTEGQKVASLVRPEYAAQAAAFTDKVQAMNVSDETKGLIMSQMGGDLYLPDPKKWEAKMKERHGNDPALLSNILTYMGGGAGKVGHNK